MVALHVSLTFLTLRSDKSHDSHVLFNKFVQLSVVKALCLRPCHANCLVELGASRIECANVYFECGTSVLDARRMWNMECACREIQPFISDIYVHAQTFLFHVDDIPL